MDTQVSTLPTNSAINTLMHISRMFLRQPLLLVPYLYCILVVTRLTTDAGTKILRLSSIWLIRDWPLLPFGKNSTTAWLILYLLRIPMPICSIGKRAMRTEIKWLKTLWWISGWHWTLLDNVLMKVCTLLERRDGTWISNNLVGIMSFTKILGRECMA